MSSQTRSLSSLTRANRISSFTPNVWVEVNNWLADAAAKGFQVTNLGQGFPNFAIDEKHKGFLEDVFVNRDMNQYTRAMGHPRLVQAISDTFSHKVFGSSKSAKKIDPMTEVLTTNGACEALFLTSHAFLDPGDECIIIEPFYDSYAPNVIMAGGKPVFVPLRKPEGAKVAQELFLDMDELKAAITPKTRMLILNTPNNPTGKMFSRAELQELSELVIAHDLLVVSDEVYEHLTYDDVEHVRIASLPGMWERTITIGSAGKTFGATGWKIGWCYGPSELIGTLNLAHQYVNFNQPTGTQETIAMAFEAAPEDQFFERQRAHYTDLRANAQTVMEGVGLSFFQPSGAYFALLDTSHLNLPAEARAYAPRRDKALCRFLTTEVGVTFIPPSVFYSPEHAHLADDWLRVCFCKTKETMQEAGEKLQKMESLLR